MRSVRYRSDSLYEVSHINGAFLGEYVREIDGFFVFYPAESSIGAWSGALLRMLTDDLYQLNAYINLGLTMKNKCPCHSHSNLCFTCDYAGPCKCTCSSVGTINPLSKGERQRWNNHPTMGGTNAKKKMPIM